MDRSGQTRAGSVCPRFAGSVSVVSCWCQSGPPGFAPSVLSSWSKAEACVKHSRGYTLRCERCQSPVTSVVAVNNRSEYIVYSDCMQTINTFDFPVRCLSPILSQGAVALD